ncbi:hypothetical protein BEL07_17095 [Mycolicibacterium grossiae]|uniref:Uncharacterized protein n=1 Tax=Mycolicibacterium grossiae TaxID=1552759 RepID=A0A1E8Q3H6_9MYCO|nr:hypothetical protein BEL07_17095 [Mycolicibacterium grossiae]
MVTTEAHDVVVMLGREDAERLDGRIRRLAESARAQLVKVAELVEEAKQGRIHEALGYKSWPAYLMDALGGRLQLPGEDRLEVVAYLAGEGMSTRAIASVTGVSKSTVANDLSQVSSGWTPGPDAGVQELDTSSSDAAVEVLPPSETITTVDGKSFKREKSKPKSAPVVTPRKVVERIAPRLDGMVMAIDGLDPAEVDGDAVREKVDVIRDAVGKLTTFIDKVSPPKPVEVAAESESGRKVQIPTAFRRNVGEALELLKAVDRLRMDPRWDKAADRFKTEDRISVGVLLTLVSELHKTLGGDGMPVTGDPLEGFVEATDEQLAALSAPSPTPASGRPSPASMPRRKEAV